MTTPADGHAEPSSPAVNSRAERHPLRGCCDGCFSPDGIWIEGEYRCAKCAQLHAITDAAIGHFTVMLRDVLEALHDAYQGTVAMDQMTCQVGMIAQDVADEIAQARKQPASASEVNA